MQDTQTAASPAGGTGAGVPGTVAGFLDSLTAPDGTTILRGHGSCQKAQTPALPHQLAGAQVNYERAAATASRRAGRARAPRVVPDDDGGDGVRGGHPAV